MEIVEIKNRLNKALEKLYVKDWYLLEKSAHERSITHKLAEYLQELFPDYDVDCEYNLDIDNRQGNSLSFKRWADERKINSIIKELKKKQDYTSVMANITKLSSLFYPDIIIHKRGTNRQNLLVIECKKNQDEGNDKEKLKALTINENNRINHYAYKLGAFIRFNNENNLQQIEYFITGQLEHNN
jgi:hypothetical protein